MSSKNKAKEQQYSTGGLYGSSTTGKRGTSYNPSDFEKQLVGQTTSAIPQYLQQLITPTYDSQPYLNREKQLENSARIGFENNVINPLAERGLTRGSSVNQMANQFNNNLVDARLDLMNSEDARVNKVLSSLMGYYQTPYNMMTGINNGSGNLYSQAVQNQGNNFGDMASAIGTIAGGALGAYYGGPEGMAAGAEMGNKAGSLLG